MDESVLIQAAQGGNRSALRELFEQNKHKIFALAYQYARNREDAEDILQETFIKAFRRIHTFRVQEETRFSAWIFRIGIHCSIDYLRRNKARKSELGEAALVALPAESPGTDPLAESARREFRHRIERFLADLSPKQRMIFVLKHDKQFTIREIASELRCTEGSVKTHLFRAVSALRKGFRDPALEETS